MGDVVALDGSGSSDPNGDPLTFSWSLTARPAGSGATLSNTGADNPSFVADEAGTYVVQLIVNDGEFDSAPDTVTIVSNVDQPDQVDNVNLPGQDDDADCYDDDHDRDRDDHDGSR